MILHGWLRSGKADSARGVMPFLQEALALMPPAWMLRTVRADSGFFDQPVLYIAQSWGGAEKHQPLIDKVEPCPSRTKRCGKRPQNHRKQVKSAKKESQTPQPSHPNAADSLRKKSLRRKHRKLGQALRSHEPRLSAAWFIFDAGDGRIDKFRVTLGSGCVCPFTPPRRVLRLYLRQLPPQ
jgi:hypothetical protein